MKPGESYVAAQKKPIKMDYGSSNQKPWQATYKMQLPELKDAPLDARKPELQRSKSQEVKGKKKKDKSSKKGHEKQRSRYAD